MITINLFTSGKHTRSLIEALRKAKDIKLENIYTKLPIVYPTPGWKPNIKYDTPGCLTQTDVFVVADFGQIIDKQILGMSQYGSLCVHPSLLPKYRGASPVQQAIINGEKETGVTIIQMDEKVDHGPILVQSREKIKENDTSKDLYERLFTIAAKDLINILPDYVEGKIKPTKQNHNQATYTKILTRNDGKIDWGKSDEEIERFIRAMSPWPGAWCWIKIQGSTKRLKILKTHLKKIHNTKYIIHNTKLVLDLVQLEGKKPVTWKQFKEGYPEAKFVKSG